MKPGSKCPCGTGRAYAACCGPYHAGEPAPTPEALMRSRYSAFALQLKDYILATWHPRTRPGRPELADGAAGRTWIRLQIRRTAMTAADEGIVEFVASYRIGGSSAQRLHETSRFTREDGRWLYVDGDVAE